MLLDHLKRHVLTQPDAAFLREAEEELTFGQFFDRVTRLAARLRACGVSAGDRVVLYLDRHSRHLIAYLATMAAGAIPVHLYPQRKPAFVAFAVRHTGARLILIDREGLDPADFPCMLFSLTAPDAFSAAPLWPGDCHQVAYMMFTSGTTGTPKAVMTTQGNVDFITRTLIKMADMRVGDREIIVMPLGSTGGLGHFHAHLTLGNPLILMPYFFGAMDDNDMAHMLQTVADEGITGFLSTPAMLGRLVTTHRAQFQDACRELRYLLANVTPIRGELVRDLLTLLPDTRLHTYYGLTEASRSVHQCYRDFPGKESAAGRPSDGMTIKIDHPNVQGVGEVLIKGPNVMAGYWGMGNHGFDAQRWFRSGDLGQLDKDGFLTILGRLKENIKVDGLECLPRDVEEVLLDHPEVADCAVVGLADPITYQRIAAAIVPVNGGETVDLAARLRDYCAEKMEFYKVPTRFAVVDAIPRTDLGKIRRDELAELLAGMDLAVIGE